MDLNAFRVTMYKGIIDSGWVDVDGLTVFVGKNESGKTSLLRALHKLNPYTPDPYHMNREWPRGRRKDQDEDIVVCWARFQISDEEKSDLIDLTGIDTTPDTVEVVRDYAGELTTSWPEDMLLDKPSPNDIDDAFYVMPAPDDECSARFIEIANVCMIEARHFADERTLTELRELGQKHENSLRAGISSDSQGTEKEFIDHYLSGLEEVVQTLEGLPSLELKLHDYVINHLPTFIYMDDYRAFSGTARLNEIKGRKDSNSLGEADETFLSILELSGLDLDELVQFGQVDGEEREERQYNLDDGASTLTTVIEKRFGQRRYEVQFRVDDQYFFTFVRDDHDPALIRLEERSKGFQWFFSFDLMLMHESEGTFKGCVLLLDEPGLHLHPDAQKALLGRLAHYAMGNTLLYTTHLPFMIDLDYPERIKVLEETNNGIVVTTNLTGTSPDTKFVLQAALGMDISQSLFVTKNNLVVEGVEDYLVFSALSNLLQEDGGRGLSDDVRITPGGGASEAVYLATFMIGQGLNVVVLFDSDKAGKDARNKLDHKWLTWYTEHQTKVVMLGEAVDTCDDFALEDLFPDYFYIEALKEAYSKELKGVGEITLQGKDMLSKRVERFMKDKTKKFNRGPVAKRLARRINGMKDSNELPDETREKAVKLFQEIRGALQGKKTRKS